MKNIVFAAIAIGLTATPVLVEAQERPRQLSFREMDKNGNQTVDFEEWRAGNRNPRMFSVIDTNGDGEISLEEMRVQEQKWRAEREAREANRQN